MSSLLNFLSPISNLFPKGAQRGISEFFGGKKGGFEQFPTMGPEQQQLLHQILGIGGEGLQQGGDVISQLLGGNQQFLEQMQAPELRRFEEQIIPQLSERFSGAGAGSQGSSAFQQALGGAGADLAERLAGQRAQLGQQGQLSGLQGLMQLLGLGVGTQEFGTSFRPDQPGFLQGLAGGIGQGLGAGASGLFLGR